MEQLAAVNCAVAADKVTVRIEGKRTFAQVFDCAGAITHDEESEFFACIQVKSYGVLTGNQRSAAALLGGVLPHDLRFGRLAIDDLVPAHGVVITSAFALEGYGNGRTIGGRRQIFLIDCLRFIVLPFLGRNPFGSTVCPFELAAFGTFAGAVIGVSQQVIVDIFLGEGIAYI